MKKTIIGAMFVVLVAAGVGSIAWAHNKQTIVHKGKEINVSCHALPAHRGHGDRFRGERQCSHVFNR